MAETRRKPAVLAVAGEGVDAELGRSSQRVAREGAMTLATLKAAARKWSSDLAKMLGAASQRNVGLLASEIDQMSSAPQRVLEEGSAPSPPTEADVDEAVTAAALLVARSAAAADAVPPAAAAKAVSQRAAEPLAELFSALDAIRDGGSGMSFVPAIVRRLNVEMPVPEALDLLLRTARRELRPERGRGRLTEEELALCPPGPPGTPLSWARRSAGAVA